MSFMIKDIRDITIFKLFLVKHMAMAKKSKELGALGEKFAADYLQSKGYKILEINYSKPYGEIDIISKKDRELVFCEVKTSLYVPNSSFSPEFRVDKRKLSNLAKTSQMYLLEKMFHPKQLWRVDVISILIDVNNKLYKLEHFQNINFNNNKSKFV